jgi:uracil phosphoribosyltransferase
MQHEKYSNLIIPKHPLIVHKLSQLRNCETSPKIFRELVGEITLLLGYEATKALPLTNITIQTPLTDVAAPHLAVDNIVIVPILRAGLGMVDALLTLIPSARVGHIGLYRDEKTFEPKDYYFKVPEHSSDLPYFLCDPMLATGGSLVHAIDLLKARGVKDLRMICLVAAPTGVEKMLEHHPDVAIYCASLDDGLTAKAYITPGLGDAGDRIFGTK